MTRALYKDPKVNIHFHTMWIEECHSTNTELKAMLDNGAAHPGLVLVTKRQKQGRGRHTRVWESPAGNLALSFLLPCPADMTKSFQLSLIVSLALVELLHKKWQCHDARVKWPNDVLIRGKKVAGVLCEMIAEKKYVIVGIGINYNSSLADFDIELQKRITTLKDEKLSLCSEDDFLTLYFDELRKWIEIYYTKDFSHIRQEYLARSMWLNETIHVTDEDGSLTSGLFKGIDKDGLLLLLNEHNEITQIISGDVGKI